MAYRDRCNDDLLDASGPSRVKSAKTRQMYANRLRRLADYLETIPAGSYWHLEYIRGKSKINFELGHNQANALGFAALNKTLFPGLKLTAEFRRGRRWLLVDKRDAVSGQYSVWHVDAADEYFGPGTYIRCFSPLSAGTPESDVNFVIGRLRLQAECFEKDQLGMGMGYQ